MDDDTFITPAEAAQLLRLSLSAMRLRIRRREVPVYRVRRSRLIRLRRADVLALLEPTPPTLTAAPREGDIQPPDMTKERSHVQ